jgi:hypothetical protein
MFLIDRKTKGVKVTRTSMADSRNAANIQFRAVRVTADQILGEKDHAAAALDRARIGTEQDRDQVFLCRDLLLEHGNRGARLLELGADLRQLDLGHDPALEAQLENAQRLGVVLLRLPRDLELAIERTHRQGLIARRFAVDELFDGVTGELG